MTIPPGWKPYAEMPATGGVARSRIMKGTRPLGRSGLVLALAVAVVMGIFAGSLATWGFAPLAFSAPGANLSPPGAGYTLYMTVAFNPGSGHDEYFPANFTVPAHVLVAVTIANYDNGTNVVPGVDGLVKGTLGGTETIVNASYPDGEIVPGVNGTEISHTFTVATGGYDLNIPVPPAPSLSVPTLVTFETYFNVTGSFVWHCLAPCDMISMMTPGFMMGTMTVESA